MSKQKIIIAVLVDDLKLSYPVAGPFPSVEEATSALSTVREVTERLYSKNRFKCWHIAKRYGCFSIPMEETLFGWERKDQLGKYKNTVGESR